MNRLPFFIGLALGVAIWGLLTFVDSDPDIFGKRATRELATARAEIALARAEHRAALREIDKVKKDHKRLFMAVEEAYFGCHSITRERKNEKAVPSVDRRPGR